MKKDLLLTCFLLVIIFTSCEPTNPTNNGYKLSVNLDWADKSDQGIELQDIYFWVFHANGELVKEHYYPTEQGATLDLLLLSAGEYNVITATNFATPFSTSNNSKYDNFILKLDKASFSPSHAYWGVTNVSVSSGKIRTTTLSLRRILSEITIGIDDVPKGTSLDVLVANVADGIYPSQKDNDGNLGRAASGINNIVTIPKATAVNGTISTNTMRLMPTVIESTKANGDNSYLHLLFTFPDGSTRECDAQAPPMRSSGRYSLNMNYSQLKPYMIISPVKINDWEEGWIVTGEILNPVEK